MNRFFPIALIVACLLGAVMVVRSTSQTSSLILTPAELTAKAGNGPLHRVRVGGKVSNQAIDYKTEPAIELRFVVEDKDADEPVHVPVVYRGIKPDMFAAGREVLIDGEFKDGELVAASLMTQCPSKYEPPVPGQQHNTSGNTMTMNPNLVSTGS